VTQPLKLPLVLLNLFAPGHDALAGDLVEQGGSRIWLWRQVIGAVIHASLADVRAYPVLAARSVLIGWLLLAIGHRVMFALVAFPEWLFVTGVSPSLFRHGVSLPSWSRGFPAIAAWKVLLFAASGWVVARTYRRNPLIVLPYTAFIACGNAVSFALYLLDPHRYYSLAQLIADLLVLYPLAACGGGLWATVRREPLRART
jgi:hypothetical protein